MLRLSAFFCWLIVPVAFAARPLELQDYYRVESASAPAMSPDGRWVACVRWHVIEAENRRASEIWLSPADGSAAAIRLTNPAFDAADPRWSPDGKVLAFRSNRKGAGDVWFLNMQGPGGEAFQIPGVGGTPIFSPDNQWIAFTKKNPVERPAAEGTPLERTLAERFKGRMYDWMNYRFDGRGYLADPRDPAATPAAELYIVPRQGGEPKRLTNLNVDVESAVWKPDSHALAIVADSHQRDEYSYERPDIWVVDLDGHVRRLTDNGYHYDAPDWSPDGRYVVVRRSQSLNQVIAARQDHGGAVDLYRLQVDNGSLQNLTADWDLIPENPRWTGNGEFIYFSGAVGGEDHLFRLAANGGHAEQVTKSGRARGGFSFSKGFDAMAYALSDATHPQEVYAAKVNGSGETKLSAFNDAWLREVELADTQTIRYPSADGTEIEAYLTVPRNAKSSYPLILNIHGGPHGAFGSAFDFDFQWMAANGFAVLAPNPRGSTGYGEKFLWATWGGWGKLDYQDVMAGVDYVLAHDPADPKRLLVSGYSYGGFLTNWIVTQTDRFIAAVSGAGVVNWISDYGTSDIPRTKESEFYGTPWQSESAERMRQYSPITYVAKVKTPVLFVNGESDMRVPIEEAEQMYRALKKLRVPAKFIRYPGNYHGGWPPWDVVHRDYQEMQWFLQACR